MKRSSSASAALIAILRRQLRRQGWTAVRIATTLGIGEATAKRWLAGRGLSLDRLEQLADLAGMSFAELARAAEQDRPALARELTLAQERALSGDTFLSFLFMTILGGTGPDEIAQDFGVPMTVLEPALLRLERLALIDRLRGGRVRPLVDRSLAFRKTPLRATFEHQMKPQFMAMDFAAPDAIYASEVIKLSDMGAAQLAELIERHRRDVQALAEQDRERTLLQRQWYGMLCALRPLDTSGLQASAPGDSG
ncbi:MAG: hypothetical protein IPN84_05035 [Sphingomonadales bacterium]|nr:hypothetical protein [Sphingomonadales bacterium]